MGVELLQTPVEDNGTKTATVEDEFSGIPQAEFVLKFKGFGCYRRSNFGLLQSTEFAHGP